MIGELIFTASTLIVCQFDAYITDNYRKIKSEARTITGNHPEFEDILHDCIIKIRQKIEGSAIRANDPIKTIKAYLFTSIYNQYTTTISKQKKKQIIDVDGISGEDEWLLTSNNDHDYQMYYEHRDVFIKYLFQYVETRYDQKKATLFKTYYLTSSNTYDKLKKESGYSTRYIKDTLSIMKKDVKTNLNNYINESIKNDNRTDN